MIEEIIDSVPKSAIVSFLLLAPGRGFSTIELSKRLSLRSAAITTILPELVKANILIGYSRSRVKFYALNLKNQAMVQLQGYMAKHNKKYDDELMKAIAELGDIKGAFLSGVFTATPQLPVDLLLVGKVNLSKLDKFLKNSKKMMGLDINYSIMTEQEFKLRRHTFDRFIKDIFDYPHLTVVDKLKIDS